MLPKLPQLVAQISDLHKSGICCPALGKGNALLAIENGGDYEAIKYSTGEPESLETAKDNARTTVNEYRADEIEALDEDEDADAIAEIKPKENEALLKLASFTATGSNDIALQVRVFSVARACSALSGCSAAVLALLSAADLAAVMPLSMFAIAWLKSSIMMRSDSTHWGRWWLLVQFIQVFPFRLDVCGWTEQGRIERRVRFFFCLRKKPLHTYV